MIETRIEEIQSVIQPYSEYLEYDGKRIELLKECSSDKDGNVLTRDIGGGNIEYIIQAEKKDLFQEKIEDLKKEYSDAIQKQIEKQTEIDNFLNQEIDPIEFKLIQIDSIPSNLKSIHLEKIYDLIQQ